MLFNIQQSEADVQAALAEGSMIHLVSSHCRGCSRCTWHSRSPCAWWRRGVPTVAGAAVAAMALHVVLFGWVTRCGSGLPLAFVLAFLGALAYERTRAWIVLGLGVLLSVIILTFDATAARTR